MPRYSSILTAAVFQVTSVTHVHRDHYTNAIALRRELGCSVSLGVGERFSLEAINGSARYGMDPHVDGLAPCGAGFLADEIDIEGSNHGLPDDIWDQADEWLQDGDLIRLESRELQVMHTPGHTIGHVVFHDVDAALLFSGDHVLPRITPSIGFEPVATHLPLANFLSSLARVGAVPDAMLLPAHGPVIQSAHQRVAELLEHHEHRLAVTEGQVRVDERTVHEVAQHLLWTRREKKLAALDPFNRMLAVLETKAHLDLLVHRGSVERRLEQGLLLYSAHAD